MKKSIKNVMTFCALLYGLSVIGQNQIWPIGNQQWNGVFGAPQALPTPAGPSGLDYAGQQAQYAANAWHHPQTGALLFFVVDGVVYDGEGYYLGTLNVNNDTDPTTKRIMGFSEVSIVPDPGDCKRFYIIGSSPNASFLNSPPINAPAANIADVFGEMHYAVVNLGLPREYFNETRMGTLENLSTGFEYIKSLRALIPAGQKYANNQNTGWTSVDFLAVSPKNSSNQHLIFYQDHFNILYTFQLGTNGITYVNNSGFDTRSGLPFNFSANVIIDHVSRSELELIVLPNGNYRVVGLSYNLVIDNINNSSATVPANKLYRLDFGASGIPISSSYAEHQHYQTPQGDGLARIKGIEVSPNKQFVYYTALNTTGLPRSIYCLDMNTFAQVSLPAITDAFSHQFKHSMIERANNGTADGAVYFSHPNGLFQLNNPNNPTIANLTQTVFVNLQMSRLNATAGAYNDGRIGLYLLPDQMDFDPNCQVGCYSFACGDNSAAEACCQFYSNISPNPNEVVFDNIVVSATTQWTPGSVINGTAIPANGSFRVNGNIIILPGATLTMNGLYIEFSPTSKVLVSRGVNANATGARLNVVNSTLTAAQICGNCYMWLGIEAHGYANAAQNSLGQSRVNITTNSKIEYAHNGVFFGNLTSWNAVFAGGLSLTQMMQQLQNAISHTGGRIIAQNSTFLNNKHDVTFLPYANQINSSSFYNCDFTTNENLPTGAGNGINTPIHISIWNNRGIQIGTCRFSNTTPNLNDGSFRGIGISSTNSNFTVFSYTGTPPSQFNNLNIGIRAQGGSGLNFSVFDANFNNNYCGIFARNEKSSNIQRNQFFVFNPGPNSNMETYGVYLEGCNRYTVKRNYFTSLPINLKNGNVYGVVADNSGPFSNKIEMNKFEHLHSGGVSRRVNSEITEKRRGLQWLCNEFYNNDLHDLWVQQGASISILQGIHIYVPTFPVPNVLDHPAGNIFYTSNNPAWHIRLENDVPNIVYFHDMNNAPTLYTQNKVALVPTPSSYTNVMNQYCQFRFEDIPSMSVSDLEAEREGLYQDKKIIDDLTDFGNKDSLILEIFSDFLTDEQKRDLLRQQNITISDEVLIEYILSEPQPLHLYQVLVYNSPLTDKVIYYMMEESNLPNGMKQQILFVQSGLSEFEARQQASQEYSLKVVEIEDALFDKFVSDTTGVYGINNLAHLFETAPEKDFANLEMLFQAYLADYNVAKADSVNTILKELVNDAGYDFVNDVMVAAVSSDFFTVLLSDSILIEQLVMLAEQNDYRYSYKAKAILSGYLGFFFEPGSGIIGGTKNMIYPKYTYDGSTLETVSIFPNPAQDHFFIVFDENADVSQNREVKVYDLSGVLQFTREMKANDYVLEITTENLAKGMYLVVISANGKEISTQKVAVR